MKKGKSLKDYSIHAATLAAAGVSMAGKSDAAVIAVGGSGQTGSFGLNFQAFYDGKSGLTLRVCSSTSFCLGMDIALSGSTLFGSITSCASPFYSFYNTCSGDMFFESGSAPDQDISFSSVWSSSGSISGASPGDRFVFGWRYSPTAGGMRDDYYYGWTEVEIGSVIHGVSHANDTLGGGIQFGEIPEPGSVALLALGGAGIATQRRRRKEAA